MILVLLPLSLLMAAIAVAAFRWAARDGQFDDLPRGAFTPLADDARAQLSATAGDDGISGEQSA
jgi:cbb3-type cytochrome oxidase maturation protein